MITISKGREPRELLTWKHANRATPQNLNYDGGGFPRGKVRQSLLAEQKYLCAYTLKKLPTISDCHIEHIRPQSLHPLLGIEYQNMLACFPGNENNTHCEYGAVFKKNYDPDILPFISPLHPSATDWFQFSERGTVTGLNPAACVTVAVLNLNHSILVNDRAAAIRGRLIPQRGKSISAADARRLARMINQTDHAGHLPQYCQAISQAALKHAGQLENRARRAKTQRKI